MGRAHDERARHRRLGASIGSAASVAKSRVGAARSGARRRGGAANSLDGRIDSRVEFRQQMFSLPAGRSISVWMAEPGELAAQRAQVVDRSFCEAQFAKKSFSVRWARSSRRGSRRRSRRLVRGSGSRLGGKLAVGGGDRGCPVRIRLSACAGRIVPGVRDRAEPECVRARDRRRRFLQARKDRLEIRHVPDPPMPRGKSWRGINKDW